MNPLGFRGAIALLPRRDIKTRIVRRIDRKSRDPFEEIGRQFGEEVCRRSCRTGYRHCSRLSIDSSISHLPKGVCASQKALSLSSRYSDAMNDRTRTDRARRGKWSWRIPSASVAFAAKQANEWHRWYAWHPVICDNASGGVAWGLTILRRRERGGWVYRMGLRNRRV